MPGEELYRKARTEYRGEDGSIEAISFFDKNGRINIYKMISNERIVNIDFIEGQLRNIRFSEVSDNTDYGLNFEDNHYVKLSRSNSSLLRYQFDNEHSRKLGQNHVVVPEIIMEIEDGMIKVDLLRNGKTTDELRIPVNIDSEQIFQDMYPGQILKDPLLENPIFDLPAKQPPLARIGAKWEVLEDSDKSVGDDISK